MGLDEMKRIGAWMLEALKHATDEKVHQRIRGEKLQQPLLSISRARQRRVDEGEREVSASR